MLFDQPTVASLMEAMQKFDPTEYDTDTLRAHAETFDRRVFEQKISTFVDQAYHAFKKGQIVNP